MEEKTHSAIHEVFFNLQLVMNAIRSGFDLVYYRLILAELVDVFRSLSYASIDSDSATCNE